MNDIELLEKHLGIAGSKLIIDTTRADGIWKKMVIIENAVLDEFTDDTMDGASGILGVTLTAGTTIQGNITSIKLTSGKVILYS